MSRKKKSSESQVVDVLNAAAWPTRRMIGPRCVAGIDHNGYIGIGTVGGDMRGSLVLTAFVMLTPEEAEELRLFLMADV